MREIGAEQLDINAFESIGRQWMLVGVSKEGESNVMTASWGGLGVMWNKNVAFVFVRPQRYTKEFIDGSDFLSLSFFDGKYDKMLAYMGKTSGRDEDKISKCGLTLIEERAPVFEQADITLICKKLYSQTLVKDGFFDISFVQKYYPDADFHQMYVAEIEKILIK